MNENEKEDYKKISKYVGQYVYDREEIVGYGEIVKMGRYDKEINKNFRRYGDSEDDIYTIIYLNLMNNGVNRFLYLSADKMGEVSVPITHIYGSKSNRRSAERKALDEKVEIYRDKLTKELSRGLDSYEARVHGLIITVTPVEMY